jgi:hypothetical protein
VAASPSLAACTIGNANLMPFVERLLDHCVALAANDELLPRHGHYLRSDLHRIIAELIDTLHFQELDDQRARIPGPFTGQARSN